MTITERHQFILQRLQENGRVDIHALSEQMEVSGVTIRKDLKLLEEKKLLFRTKRGGSINNPYAAEKPINEKEFINADQKKRIGRVALRLVEDTDSIIIGSGTTVFELARILYPAKRLVVITPALKVALELYNRANTEVLQLGGLIHQSSASAADSIAEKILENISCDILFLGVDGIDPEFGLSIANITEASLNTKMIQLAQKTVIMADSTKFGRRGLGRIAGVEQVQYIITDPGISASTKKSLEEKGVTVLLTE
ncbi:MAG: DeoR/GlpR transcriptional regulator [Bacteroidetes bacterium]|nr:DeoR/GlpR transcriptional regulator [Bacteroidota bacterium]